MRKIFTFLLAALMSVGMFATTVTWNNDDITGTGSWGTSFTKDGVTITAGDIDFMEKNFMQGGTFTTTLGNFTKIEVSGGFCGASGTGWSGNSQKKTWTGNASSVSFSGDFMGMGMGDIKFVFTIGEPDPTYTIALQDGTANADKVTLSKTSAVEGATVTVTPNEEYEITAFKATYNTTEELSTSFNAETDAYSFKMPAANVTIEATIAAKPVPEGDIFAGFTATAGSGGFDNEGSANLVDNKFTSTEWTKWCTNNDHRSVPTGESGDACWWIDFKASAALNPTGYILTTGNDTGNEHGRNPKNWVLKAKLNAGDAWTTIATVTNDVTMKNKSFKDYKFFVDQPGSYKYFRFEVFANQGANVMQLCELRLIGTETPAPQPTTYTLQLHVNDAAMGSVAVTNLLGSDIVDNGDGTYTVPEGAEVTLQATPNEGYEFIGWKASSTICDFADCEFVALPTVDNPMTIGMHQEVAIMAEFAAVASQPVEDVNITPNVDPDHAGVYYSTFYDSEVKYLLPENVEAYIVTTVSGDAMQLQKVAVAGQTIPAGAGVILKASVTPFTLTPSDAEVVSVAGNRLEGSDASIDTPSNCYVLSCENNLVGFYHYTADKLNAHKAYIIYSGSLQAPRRLRFVFDQATGVESIQPSAVSSQKVLRDGQLVIIRNGVEYNAAGQMVK